MPLAIPLVIVGGALLLFLIRVILLLLMIPAADAAGKYVPVVGKYLKQAGYAVAVATTRAYDALITDRIQPAVEWFRQLADRLTELPEEMAAFTVRLYTALDNIVTERIPAIVSARVAPVTRKVEAVAGRLDGVADRVGQLDRGIDTLRDTTIPALRTRLDAAVDRLTDVTLPALRRDVFRGIDELRNDLLGRIGGGLTALRGELTNLREYVDSRLNGEVLRQGVELAALGALIATTVMPAVRAVERCSRKLNLLCATDPDVWDEVFMAAIPAIGLGAAVAMVEEMIELAPSAVEGVEQMLRT